MQGISPFILQEWYDQRLNWSSAEFGGVTSIRIPCHKLWLPDIVLYNSSSSSSIVVLLLVVVVVVVVGGGGEEGGGGGGVRWKTRMD
ncbi:neuronal acetylcholine receptor subunit alpha-2 [Elysia marginata]|uniref:Neuronal acetylcholine receptor subunit alpha-2 n=1 Tax=Elysia marginata TaxID=1093978 RepID=A0AAV4H0S7_9GAST|nr:neuronal acetylcholine receptor subunit alpha-2 [Elysia marginata]